MLTASYDGEVKLWTDGGQTVKTVSLQQPVFNACFSPSGERILVTGSLPYFYVYTKELKQVFILNRHYVKEWDTLDINKREKELGSPVLLSTNST